MLQSNFQAIDFWELEILEQKLCNLIFRVLILTKEANFLRDFRKHHERYIYIYCETIFF